MADLTGYYICEACTHSMQREPWTPWQCPQCGEWMVWGRTLAYRALEGCAEPSEI